MCDNLNLNVLSNSIHELTHNNVSLWRRPQSALYRANVLSDFQMQRRPRKRQNDLP